MLYLVHLAHAGMAVRFQLAMLKLVWMKSQWGGTQWSLTSLDLKVRGHSEKYWVVSFYGTRTTSSFQAGRQSQHRLRVVACHLHLHHLQEAHPMTTTTTARVHLDLRRSLRLVLNNAGAQSDKCRPSQEYLIRIFLLDLTIVLTRKPT